MGVLRFALGNPQKPLFIFILTDSAPEVLGLGSFSRLMPCEKKHDGIQIEN